jgi:hypothetical protein
MAAQTGAKRIRLGILALPLASTILLVSVLFGAFASNFMDLEDLETYAELITSARYSLGVLLFGIGNLLFIFGLFSLYAYLASSRAERLALVAMILSVLSLASFMGFVGVASVESVAAELYLQGQRGVLEAYMNTVTPEDMFLAINNLSMLVGLLLFGIAIWRSDVLPHGAAIVWIAADILSGGAGVLGGMIVYLVSFGLFTVANVWIAWTVWRRTSVWVVEAEARARVQ